MAATYFANVTKKNPVNFWKQQHEYLWLFMSFWLYKQLFIVYFTGCYQNQHISAKVVSLLSCPLQNPQVQVRTWKHDVAIITWFRLCQNPILVIPSSILFCVDHKLDGAVHKPACRWDLRLIWKRADCLNQVFSERRWAHWTFPSVFVSDSHRWIELARFHWN